MQSSSIDRDNYFLDREYVSNSQLKVINHCPAKYRYEYIDTLPGSREDEKDHFRIGRILHSLVLEPETFHSQYMLVDKIDGRNRDAADLKMQQAIALNGRTPVYDHKEYYTLLEMKRSIYSHPLASALCMAKGQVESVITWTDPYLGVKCKSMRDKVIGNIILDLKTIGTHADLESFKRQCLKMDYHQQNAFYVDGTFHATGEKSNFVFIVVEKKPPYLVAVYSLSKDMVEAGRQKYYEAMSMYKSCMDNQFWPDYNNGQLTIIH